MGNRTISNWQLWTQAFSEKEKCIKASKQANRQTKLDGRKRKEIKNDRETHMELHELKFRAAEKVLGKKKNGRAQGKRPGNQGVKGLPGIHTIFCELLNKWLWEIAGDSWWWRQSRNRVGKSARRGPWWQPQWPCCTLHLTSVGVWDCGTTLLNFLCRIIHTPVYLRQCWSMHLI